MKKFTNINIIADGACKYSSFVKFETGGGGHQILIISGNVHFSKNTWVYVINLSNCAKLYIFFIEERQSRFQGLNVRMKLLKPYPYGAVKDLLD